MQKGAFSEFLTQHLQELDDDEGNIYCNACRKLVTQPKSVSHTELLAIQNAIQDKELKAILERSISTISGNSGDKS